VAIAVGALVLRCAPPPPSRQIDVPVRQFELSQVKLPSGLQVIIEDDPSARVVVSVLVVGAGAAEDPAGQEGLAHLVEHLTFRAKRADQPALSARLALNGIGAWNAATSLDTTTYYQVGAPETLPRMIELEIGRMLDPLQGVDAEHFNVERGVVLNELHFRDESGVNQEVRRVFLQQLFAAGHPYARGVGGTEESLPKLTLEQAQAFVRAHYRPEEMTWVLAGDFDRQLVASLLDHAVPPQLRNPQPAVPDAHHVASAGQLPPAPAKLPTVSDPAARRPQLLVGWVLPPGDTRMEPVYSSLPAFVEGRAQGISGVESADAQMMPLADASVLLLFITLQEGRDPEETVKKLRDDWAWFWRERNTATMHAVEKEFAYVRAASLVGLAQRNESILTRSMARALRTRSTRSPSTLKAQSEAITALTYSDILTAGRMTITGQDLRAVVIQPRTASAVEEESTVSSSPDAFAPEPVRAEYRTSAVAAFVHGPHLEVTTGFVASNGLKVDLVPLGKTGLVTATLAVPAGRRTSSPSGLADRLRWSKQSRDYGTPVGIGASEGGVWTDDSGFLEYRGSSGNLTNLLAMMSERVLTLHAQDPPKLTPSAVHERESRLFDRTFWIAVEGASSLASRPLSEIARLDGGDATRWWESVMDPGHSTLVIAGDVPPTVRDDVEHWLARWRTPREARVSTLPPSPTGPGALRVLRVPMKQAKQVRVRLGCTVQTQSLEQELATRMLGIKVERQWTSLERETVGSSYGFNTSTTVHRDGSAQLLISGRVDNGSARRMAAAVRQAWKMLPEAGAAENELNRLRWEFGRAYTVRFLTSQSVARAVAEQRLRGRTAAALDEIPAALMRVSPGDMAEVGSQCQRSAVLGLLGDPSVLDVDPLLPENWIALKPLVPQSADVH
jgi:zinc protease